MSSQAKLSEKFSHNSSHNSSHNTAADTHGDAPSVQPNRRQSLVAFLGAIKFRQPSAIAGSVERYFARPRPQARQRAALSEESYWVRSAN